MDTVPTPTTVSSSSMIDTTWTPLPLTMICSKCGQNRKLLHQKSQASFSQLCTTCQDDQERIRVYPLDFPVIWKKIQIVDRLFVQNESFLIDHLYSSFSSSSSSCNSQGWGIEQELSRQSSLEIPRCLFFSHISSLQNLIHIRGSYGLNWCFRMIFWTLIQVHKEIAYRPRLYQSTTEHTSQIIQLQRELVEVRHEKQLQLLQSQSQIHMWQSRIQEKIQQLEQYRKEMYHSKNVT